MDMSTGPRRRILHSLTLDAIAAVPEPCQEFATMAIIKARPDAGGQPREPDPPTGFADAVADIAKRDRCARADAMAKVRRERPDLYEAEYAKARPQPAEADSADVDERAAARVAFMDHARGIADRHRIPLSAAMARARVHHAADFKKAYG